MADGNNNSALCCNKKGRIMYERLREHLNTHKDDLKGYWILDYSPYKENVCNILKMRRRKSG